MKTIGFLCRKKQRRSFSMNYSALLKGLIAEMKQGDQYKRMSKPAKIFAIVATSPLILSFVLMAFFYRVLLFCYHAFSAPVDYLMGFLKEQKDDVQHATQAVLYFVCMPFIFFLKAWISIISLIFFFRWFSLMLIGYLLTFGGIRWQPFINTAAFEESSDEYICKPSLRLAEVFMYVFSGFLLLGVILFVIACIANVGVLNLVAVILLAIYAILILIVNPILFKRVKR